MSGIVDTYAQLPKPTVPPLDKNGNWSREWWMFIIALFNRTGGAGSPIDTNTLQQQDEISQDVPPITQATQDALLGVEYLWNEVQTPPNLSVLRQRIDQLEQQVLDLRPSSPLPSLEQWNAPTLQNSWVIVDSTHNPAGYWKDPHGVVHLRGFLMSGTINQSMFSLPAGYRPAYREIFATQSNNAMGGAYVDPNGSVVPFVGSNTNFSLDGITFRASQ